LLSPGSLLPSALPFHVHLCCCQWQAHLPACLESSAHLHPSPSYTTLSPSPVQDPCFRALCPSTSTCAAVDGKPTCLCPQDQVLVNGRTCQADPCLGAAPCPGDFVCVGTSGAAKCVCPKGTVKIAPNTCQAGPPTVTTSIVLFNRASFANTPIVLRGPMPDTDDATGCVNIPSSMAGAVRSLKILWDAPDGATGARVTCGLMWFWSDADCYGGAPGWGRPDNNVTIAK
ncbi:unnamed protein product, partial [Closterium sp. NIES-53]